MSKKHVITRGDARSRSINAISRMPKKTTSIIMNEASVETKTCRDNRMGN